MTIITQTHYDGLHQTHGVRLQSDVVETGHFNGLHVVVVVSMMDDCIFYRLQ